MKKHLTIIFFILINLSAFAQEEPNSGILYGDNYAFSLTAPNGWVLDNKAGVSQGSQAVFYMKGESWEKAVTVMYVSTSTLGIEGQKTLDELIKFDINNFENNYPDIKITDEKEIVIKPEVKATVKYLSSLSYGNFEAIAYIDAGKVGIMIVLSSRIHEGFSNSLAAFESLVKSYFYLTDKVKIDKNNK